MFRGVSGQWRAWKLDEYGYRVECGIIPSQMKYVSVYFYLQPNIDKFLNLAELKKNCDF
jgi:hypothetical protein